jgi:hypothetical protein
VIWLGHKESCPFPASGNSEVVVTECCWARCNIQLNKTTPLRVALFKLKEVGD